MSEVSGILLAEADGTPIDRTVGFETEYGIDGRKKGEGIFHRISADIVGDIIGDPVWGLSKSQFDPRYGTREYLDCGHPEVSTAEEISFVGAATDY